MISKLRTVFFLAAFALLGFSCAEKYETDYTEVELTTFDLWMAKYYPEYPKITDGLYYKIVKGDNSIGNTPDSTSDWVFVNYTGQDLAGNYYANTYKPLSKHLGTYSSSTHFVPLIANFNYNSSILTTGALYALGEMQEGDSVDVFMSSDWIGDASTAPYTGFEGNLYSVSNQPIRVSMKLESMTHNPSKLGVEKVQKYAIEELGLTLADSLESGIYYKILKSNPDGDTIPEDSTATIKYVAMFLDGFIFNTNDKIVAENNDLYFEGDEDRETGWSPITYSVGAVAEGSTDVLVTGFGSVVEDIRVGETVICVMAAEYAYGDSGTTVVTTADGETIVQPWDPVVFLIHVLTEDEEDYAQTYDYENGLFDWYFGY